MQDEREEMEARRQLVFDLEDLSEKSVGKFRLAVADISVLTHHLRRPEDTESDCVCWSDIEGPLCCSGSAFGDK